LMRKTKKPETNCKKETKDTTREQFAPRLTKDTAVFAFLLTKQTQAKLISASSNNFTQSIKKRLSIGNC
jgi:hypothetical protein